MIQGARRCKVRPSLYLILLVLTPILLVAILTYRIRNLWAHVDNFRRDLHNRRNLQLLLHQRATLLKYLKRTGRSRYNALLPRLGIEPEAVEGEVYLFRSLFSRLDANPNSGKKGRRKLK